MTLEDCFPVWNRGSERERCIKNWTHQVIIVLFNETKISKCLKYRLKVNFLWKFFHNGNLEHKNCPLPIVIKLLQLGQSGRHKTQSKIIKKITFAVSSVFPLNLLIKHNNLYCIKKKTEFWISWIQMRQASSNLRGERGKSLLASILILFGLQTTPPNLSNFGCVHHHL